MSIQLDQITFNFDPKRSLREPLKLRLETTDTLAPERVSATSRNAEDFVVTYGRSDDAVPEIKIKLGCPDLSVMRAEIRAIPDEANVLGNIPDTWIDFDRNGTISELTFSFPDSMLEKGVQHNTVRWEWQFRTQENEEWSTFQTTQHRLYCIFANPTRPWDREPISERVLRRACEWAKGAQSEVPAATRITEAVFKLGELRKVGYSHGATYAKALFDHLSFLDFLDNGIGTSQTLNCDDCATIVSTFGNILGCDLHQSEMGRHFETNFVRLIGDRRFAPTGFDRHAVAWKNACEANDPLYDACLQIDADGVPNARDHVPRQPTNLRFGSGDAAQNEYNFCLVSATSPYECNPRPQFMTRRGLGKSYVGQRRVEDEAYLRVLKDRYDFEAVPDDEKIGLITPRLPLEKFLDTHQAFARWKRLQIDKFVDDDLEAIDQIIWSFPDIDPAQMVEVNVYICAPRASPKDFLLQLLAQFNTMEIRLAQPDLIGAIVFGLRDQTMHLIKYHQLVGLVRSVGKKPIPTIPMAKAVQDYFVRLRSDGMSSFNLPTTTAFPIKDQHTTGEFNMTHKLATIWACHLGGEVDGLVRAGQMNLTGMLPDGTIENGRYYLPNGQTRLLKGEAVGGTPIFHLTLREFDGVNLKAIYNGVLAFESSDGRLMLVGNRRSTTGVELFGDIKIQDDSPWVISKP